MRARQELRQLPAGPECRKPGTTGESSPEGQAQSPLRHEHLPHAAVSTSHSATSVRASRVERHGEAKLAVESALSSGSAVATARARRRASSRAR